MSAGMAGRWQHAGTAGHARAWRTRPGMHPMLTPPPRNRWRPPPPRRRTVDQFLAVWNPPNAEPIVMERIDLAADGASCPDPLQRRGSGGTGLGWVHTKASGRRAGGPAAGWRQGVRGLATGRSRQMARRLSLQAGTFHGWIWVRRALTRAAPSPSPARPPQALYRLRPDSRQHLTGMTDDMCRRAAWPVRVGARLRLGQSGLGLGWG